MPAPGQYDAHRLNSMDEYATKRRRQLPNLSKASRDVSFAKYASQNMSIYTRGLH